MKKLLAVLAMVAVGALFVHAEDAKKIEEVELQGAIGCGHCMYHKGDGCAVGLKTTDGKIYILEQASKELMDARMKGGDLKVTGKVTEKDGTLYVKTSKAELVK